MDRLMIHPLRRGVTDLEKSVQGVCHLPAVTTRLHDYFPAGTDFLPQATNSLYSLYTRQQATTSTSIVFGVEYVVRVLIMREQRFSSFAVGHYNLCPRSVVLPCLAVCTIVRGAHFLDSFPFHPTDGKLPHQLFVTEVSGVCATDIVAWTTRVPEVQDHVLNSTKMLTLAA